MKGYVHPPFKTSDTCGRISPHHTPLTNYRGAVDTAVVDASDDQTTTGDTASLADIGQVAYGVIRAD